MKNSNKKLLSLLLVGTLALTGALSTTTVHASEPTMPSTNSEDTFVENSMVDDSILEDSIVTDTIEEATQDNAITEIETTSIDTYSIEPAAIGSSNAELAAYSTKDTYVVVLDPGHGKAGTGTYRDYGNFVIDEAVINLKISQYTKAALETNYDNIEVYLTKTTQNENPSIADRVAFAAAKNADILVSQHVNATSEDRTSANGVMAMVPTVDSTHAYNKDAALLSQDLARKILDQLVALGFKDNDFFYKLSENNTRYPDGSLADYYGIVRESREINLPGVIIEHGFANNESDALKLKDEAILKKIGEADARGIVEYLKTHAGYVEDSENNSENGSNTTPDPSNPFIDIYESGYYYDAVLWAYKNGITLGRDATHFEPMGECSRAQVVTFLWRAQGCPEPETTLIPFEDIPEGKFYTKAVMWAYENGITLGKDETHFAPDTTVTRAQFVTFLWRLENCPEPTIENPFVDVPNDTHFTKAILWAYENRITTGKTETTFLPDTYCLRREVVTFLYRTYSDTNL